MLMNVLLNATYELGNKIGHFGAWFCIIIFSAMFIYAMVKYVKR